MVRYSTSCLPLTTGIRALFLFTLITAGLGASAASEELHAQTKGLRTEAKQTKKDYRGKGEDEPEEGTEESIYIAKKSGLTRTTEPISADGILDEPAWVNAVVLTDFITAEPDPGNPADLKSEVRVLYDDNALYVGAMLFDPNPDSISVTLSQRDETGNADWFGMVISPYQDGANGMGFVLTAAGVQFDELWSTDDTDRNWDAVWVSGVQLNEDGWVAEFVIPYSAIRFPSANTQDWGINFGRSVRRTRQESWWSPIDPAGNSTLQQLGTLQGLENIQSPIRLQLIPYFSAYLQGATEEGTIDVTSDFNGGLDVKYGLNDAFTLDMTLIPDFGQVEFDDLILNLSPFEVRFDEKRPFFMEGTELFNKLGLFYSRRVGGTPLGFEDVFDQVEEGDSLLSNPGVARLLNASKLSGRTQGGLGVGLFNGVSAREEAVIQTSEGTTSFIETSPLTNYNVFVLDQNLKLPNSYITFTNTNVYRAGDWYDANVTGLNLTMQNKKGEYGFSVWGALSQIYNDGFNNVDLGHTFGINIGKRTGNFTWDIDYYEESDTYNPNDLGFLFNNNERSLAVLTDYNIYEPFWKLNRLFSWQGIGYGRLYNPDEFQNFWFGSGVTTIWKNFFANGLNINAEPIPTYDFFESRVGGMAYEYPTNYNINGWISSDYRKKLAIDAKMNYRWFNDPIADNRYIWNYGVEPRWRVNDKVMLVVGYLRQNFMDDVGGLGQIDNEVIFGVRDNRTDITSINASWIFTNRAFFNFRLRHYWSRAEYSAYYDLQDDRSLLPAEYRGLDDDGLKVNDVNFNAFTIDAGLTWRFAPGSDMTFVWKTAIFDQSNELQANYFNNLEQTFTADQSSNLSLRIVYFLDYVNVRKWFGSGRQRESISFTPGWIQQHVRGQQAMPRGARSRSTSGAISTHGWQ